jgi:hypothetical protein
LKNTNSHFSYKLKLKNDFYYKNTTILKYKIVI